jgi:hypothetical protein
MAPNKLVPSFQRRKARRTLRWRAIHFPTQPPELVREIVTVAHFDLKRVKELIEARLPLARESRDWDFGDWGTDLRRTQIPDISRLFAVGAVSPSAANY